MDDSEGTYRVREGCQEWPDLRCYASVQVSDSLCTPLCHKDFAGFRRVAADTPTTVSPGRRYRRRDDDRARGGGRDERGLEQLGRRL